MCLVKLPDELNIVLTIFALERVSLQRAFFFLSFFLFFLLFFPFFVVVCFLGRTRGGGFKPPNPPPVDPRLFNLVVSKPQDNHKILVRFSFFYRLNWLSPCECG